MPDVRSGLGSLLALVAGCQPSNGSTIIDAPVAAVDAYVIHDAADRDSTAPQDAVPPSDGTDDGQIVVVPSDADTDGPNVECNMLATTGPMVAYLDVPQNPPAPTGGTIVDGTYVLTSEVKYTGPGGLSGPGGIPRSLTWQFNAGTIQHALSGGMAPPDHRTYAFTTSGSSTIVIATICGDGPPPEVLAYDATSATFVLHIPNQPNLTTIETFTRQ